MLRYGRCPQGLMHDCPFERSGRKLKGRARPTPARPALKAAALAWPPNPCQFGFDELRGRSFGMGALPVCAAAAVTPAAFLPCREEGRAVLVDADAPACYAC